VNPRQQHVGHETFNRVRDMHTADHVDDATLIAIIDDALDVVRPHLEYTAQECITRR
jgi:hypothetical protein